MRIFKAVLWRLGKAICTLLLLSLVLFCLLSLVNGDAASARLAGDGSIEQIEALRHALALDQPLMTRYFSWLAHVVRGDFGHSYISGEAIMPLVLARGWASLLLGLVTIAVLIPLSIVLGLWSGLHEGHWGDRLIGMLSLGLLGMPEFVTGTLLVVVFSFMLHWLPALSLWHDHMSFLQWTTVLVLPVLTLLSVCLAQNIRLIRVGTITASRSEACQMARLNGFSERQVVLHWVMPMAMITFFPLLARYITALLSGALVAETLFSWPGLASALLNATENRDIPVIMAISMLICAVTVGINATVDILAQLATPAARRGQS